MSLKLFHLGAETEIQTSRISLSVSETVVISGAGVMRCKGTVYEKHWPGGDSGVC